MCPTRWSLAQLARCVAISSLLSALLAGGDAEAVGPSKWQGGFCGLVQCGPALPQCALGSYGAALACACDAWNLGTPVCPGRWRYDSSTDTWVSDPNGVSVCGLTSGCGSIIVFASPTADACPPGYESRGVPGLHPPEFYTCVPKDNPPPPENENRGEPDDEDLCPLGNPVNPASGNKFLREVDYRGYGLAPLVFERFYNSDSTTPQSTLGPRWRHGFDRSIRSPSSTLAYVFRPDGRVDAFTASPGSNAFASDSKRDHRLTRNADASGATQGWTLVTSTNDETEEYDSAGRLIAIRDRAGVTISLRYSVPTTPTSIAPTAGFLIQVENAVGRRLHFTYDAAGRMRSVSDPALDRPGAPGDPRYEYAYGADGDLEVVRFPDGNERRYHYNEPGMTDGGAPHALTGITDENGARFASYRYDADGRAVESQHAAGAERVRVQYLPGGIARVENFVSETLSSVREYSFSVGAKVARNISIAGSPWPGCGPQARSFDGLGLPTTVTDWNGNQTTFEHSDPFGRPDLETKRVEAAGSSEQRTITTEWHPVYRLPVRVAEPKRITTYVYGEPTDPNPGNRGNVLSRTTQATNDAAGAQGVSASPVGAPRAWTYTYNANGQVLTVDGPRTDVADLTSYTYYPNDDPDPGNRGNVAAITNALGHVTQITAYNAHGQPLTIVDPNGLATALTYDARQRLTSRSVGGEPTSYEYDAAVQLTRMTLPDGTFLAYRYDAAHRPIEIADNLGNRVSYTLDLMGNRIREDVFDPSGALAQTRSRGYNALNRLEQEIGGTNPAAQITRYGYDTQGNLTSITDPLNRVIGSAYDALHRLIRVTDPALGETRFQHDGLDQLVAITDPRNNTTSYTLDGLGNRSFDSSPDTGNSSNVHDAAGNVVSSTDAKGQTTSYSYDALDRVTRIVYNQATGSQLKQVDYGYDQGPNGIGRLTSLTETSAAGEPLSTIEWSYDPQGRITREARSIGGASHVTGYSYDAAGRMTAMTYPSGRAVNYGFDALGRVNRIETTGGGETRVVVQDVVYYPFGNPKGFTFGNLQTYSRSFDLDGRIASHTLAGETKMLTFDAASRIRRIESQGAPTNFADFGYDVLDRLTSAVLPTSTFGYSYDSVGNRLSKSTGGSIDTYTYPPTSNRLVSIAGSSGARSYVHDPNGSITSDGLNTYGYDARGRLASATSPAGTTTYQVSALGQRVSKGTPGPGGGGAGSERFFADSFPGPDGRPIDDQADGLWKGGGPRQTVATVQGGLAEIAPGKHIRTAATFALGTEGLVLKAKLLRGRVALRNADRENDGLVVRYAGGELVVARARDDDGDALPDDTKVRRRYRLASPGVPLQLELELKPGAGRIKITAGSEMLDTGEIALPEVRIGERYRIRLSSILAQGTAMSGQVDNVELTSKDASAPPPAASASTHFVYDLQGRLIGEYTAQGATLREYAYLADMPAALFAQSGATYYIHADHLNTPRVITDQQQGVVWRWENTEPFGKSLPEEDPDGDGVPFEFPLRFAGQYFDRETGLFYNYFRDYDPQTGRYGQPDPIGLAGGINPYLYGRADPLRFLDPKGLAYEAADPGVAAPWLFGIYVHNAFSAYAEGLGLSANRQHGVGTGRPDAFDPSGGFVWELKPRSHQTGSKYAAARAQVRGYCGATASGAAYRPGHANQILRGQPNVNLTVHYFGTTYDVTIFPDPKGSETGLLFYDYSRVSGGGGHSTVEDPFSSRSPSGGPLPPVTPIRIPPIP